MAWSKAVVKWLQRLVGLSAALLGIAGVVLCLAGIGWVWSVRGRIDGTVASVSVQVDDVMVRVEGRADQVTRYITEAQVSVRDLNRRVQKRVAERRNVPLAEAAEIDELERQLYARIQLATDWIGLIHSTTDLARQFMHVAESASLFAKEESRTMADLIAAIRDGREELERTSGMIEEIKAGLADIRAHGNIEENAKRITSLSGRIDTSLAKTWRYVEFFQRAVADARGEVSDFADRVRRQAIIGAMLLSVILAWSAIAQLSLAVQGWRALQSWPLGATLPV